MAVLIWCCVIGFAPAYLVQHCGPTLSARSSRSLRSTEQGLLHVLFAHTSSTRQKHAFSVVGPSIWNGFPLMLHSLPRTHSHSFILQLKKVLFGHPWAGSASE